MTVNFYSSVMDRGGSNVSHHSHHRYSLYAPLSGVYRLLLPTRLLINDTEPKMRLQD